ncbi:hypothetical protein FH972_021943 [Carpinus fangiana]|uniref:Uncharacterized protein n=1 Tax=Carpinus fangiana TaxID=176857 RepID=A0A5N6KRF5_9ROSI|nr:hypothetical protein FH972_021943 [Carpinus fangiana]
MHGQAQVCAALSHAHRRLTSSWPSAGDAWCVGPRESAAHGQVLWTWPTNAYGLISTLHKDDSSLCHFEQRANSQSWSLMTHPACWRTAARLRTMVPATPLVGSGLLHQRARGHAQQARDRLRLVPHQRMRLPSPISLVTRYFLKLVHQAMRISTCICS